MVVLSSLNVTNLAKGKNWELRLIFTSFSRIFIFLCFAFIYFSLHSHRLLLINFSNCTLNLCTLLSGLKLAHATVHCRYPPICGFRLVGFFGCWFFFIFRVFIISLVSCSILHWLPANLMVHLMHFYITRITL